MTAKLACRLCDPEVGVGHKSDICMQTCNTWYKHCQRDFFSYNALLQSLVPCGSKHALAVCSPVSLLASNGAELCALAGLQAVEQGGAEVSCFHGSQPFQYASCAAPKKSAVVNAQPGKQSLTPGMFWVLLVCCSLVLLYRQRGQLQGFLSSQQAAGRSPAHTFQGRGRTLND